MLAEDENPMSAGRRGPRPGALSKLHQRQRAASRDAIVEALLQLVGERSYDAIGIEDILAMASVSRATFYRHFKSKLEVAQALYDNLIRQAMGHFEMLARIDRGHHEAAIRWVRGVVSIYRTNGPVSGLILHLGAIDRDFHNRQRSDRMFMIRHLALTVPGFSPILEEGPEGLATLVRADLWLMTLDRACVEMTVHDGLHPEESYVAQLASELMAMLFPR
jgi:AcrR family transcriptional regulator